MPKFEEILDGIYLLKIPFSIVWTGVVLIKGEKTFLIDSGSEEPEKYLIPALEEIGVKLEDIDWLLNTHCHGDHITGHHTLVNKYGMKTATIDAGCEPLRNPAANAVRIRTKFPEFSPAPQSWLKGVEADVVLKDGELLEGRMQVIHTPGHDNDCVCWFDTKTKTLITGDSLQANGTPTQGIGFYQSLEKYAATLEKLDKTDIENIICGHEYDGIGDVILGKEKATAALDYCTELVKVYQQEIEKIAKEEELPADKIAVKLIGKIGCGMPDSLFLALYTVTEHLKTINT